jgi:hypothetical protein
MTSDLPGENRPSVVFSISCELQLEHYPIILDRIATEDDRVKVF